MLAQFGVKEPDFSPGLEVENILKKHKRVWLTLLLLVSLGILLAAAAYRCYRIEWDACLQRLRGYTQSIGTNIENSVQQDRLYLEQLARLSVWNKSFGDNIDLQESVSGYDGDKIFDRLELLLPGDELLLTDGRRFDVSGKLSFEEEAAAGVHLSRRCEDIAEPGKLIIRHFVPVQEGGETVAMLCGVVNLSNFNARFSIEEYGSDMQIYIVEGKSGDFLLDTWHEELGNMFRMGKRTMKEGYTQENLTEDFKQQRSGTLVFLSKNAGEYFYSYYTPIGLADWMVMITVPESTAFAHVWQLLEVFVILAILMTILFVCYFAGMIWEIKKEKRFVEGQLRSVSYMLEVEKELLDTYGYSGGFPGALDAITRFLNVEEAFFWMPGNSRQEELLCRSGGGSGSGEDLSVFLEKIFLLLQTKREIAENHMESLAREAGIEELLLKRLGICSLAAVIISDPKGREAGVICAVNGKEPKQDVPRLEQVMLSFSMAVNQYQTYLELVRMGQMDSLTGLQNRNSYHLALDAMGSEAISGFTCIYIDVNGLHELNNRLGHREGDAMLKASADALREHFPARDIYRIGGDEFVVFCRDQQEIRFKIEQIVDKLREQEYELSIGIAQTQGGRSPEEVIAEAERRMRREKERYYESGGMEMRHKQMDRKMEKMLSRQQDVDVFLSILAEEYKGVYFVDLKTDAVRYIFIPPYFDAMLREAKGRFSIAFELYAQRCAKPEYAEKIKAFADYDYLQEVLRQKVMPELIYEKTDGSRLRMRIIMFKEYSLDSHETLWIFEELEG